ncbi:MAG: hypothetical protein ACREDR_28840 [Blastocatellia bacterium]
MKIFKTALFCCMCLLIFLLAATLSCMLRAKYTSIPAIRTDFAYMNDSNWAHYSFLQYSQADPNRGRTALLQYLNLLRRIRSEHVQYSAKTLHLEFVLTYLHLYRLESTASHSVLADGYMKAAQSEWSVLAWKDEKTSIAAFNKLTDKVRANAQ